MEMLRLFWCNLLVCILQTIDEQLIQETLGASHQTKNIQKASHHYKIMLYLHLYLIFIYLIFGNSILRFHVIKRRRVGRKK